MINKTHEAFLIAIIAIIIGSCKNNSEDSTLTKAESTAFSVETCNGASEIMKPNKFVWVLPSNLTTDVRSNPIMICITDELGRNLNDDINNISNNYMLLNYDNLIIENSFNISQYRIDSTITEACINIITTNTLAIGWYKIRINDIFINDEETEWDIKMMKNRSYYESTFHIGSNPIVTNIYIKNEERINKYLVAINFSEPINTRENADNVLLRDYFNQQICELFSEEKAYELIANPNASVVLDEVQNDLQYLCDENIIHGFKLYIHHRLSSVSGNQINVSPSNGVAIDDWVYFNEGEIIFINGIAKII